MKEQQNDLAIFPVASWQIGPVPSYRIVTLRPNFLTHAGQKPDEANQGRYYALTPQQVEGLIQDLQKALHALQNTVEQAPPGQRQ